MSVAQTKIFSLAIFTEHKQDAGQHPYFNGGESLSFGRVGGDIVEDVDQHQEQCYQQRHATCTTPTLDEGRGHLLKKKI